MDAGRRTPDAGRRTPDAGRRISRQFRYAELTVSLRGKPRTGGYAGSGCWLGGRYVKHGKSVVSFDDPVNSFKLMNKER
jgi:hypothetical protein